MVELPSMITLTYLRTLRRYNHDVRMYLLTAALIGFSYFGVLTVLLNLYLLRLGYGTEFIGLAGASSALAFALCSAPAGALGSRFGYRRVVIAGLMCLALATITLPLAEFLPHPWAPIGIVLARLCSGLGFALYFVNSSPYLIGVTTPAERNEVFSWQVALPPIVGFAGNLAGGLLPTLFATGLGLTLNDPAPYRYPLLLTGLLLVLGIRWLLTTSELAPLATSSAQADGGVAPWLLIALLALTGLLRTTGEGASRSFFNVYLDTRLGVSTAWIGMLIALCQVLGGTATMFAPALIQRVGKVATATGATAGMAVSLLLMALLPHWAGASLGFMGAIALISIANAVITIFQMEVVAPRWRGLTSGLTNAATGIGFASMSFSGGYLIPVVGYGGVFMLSATLVLSSALIFGFYFRVPRGEEAQANS